MIGSLTPSFGCKELVTDPFLMLMQGLLSQREGFCLIMLLEVLICSLVSPLLLGFRSSLIMDGLESVAVAWNEVVVWWTVVVYGRAV